MDLFTRFEIKSQFIGNLPSKPGLYRFLNEKNEILYIGASSNLKRRISQHMANNIIENNKSNSLKENATTIEFRCYKSSDAAFKAEKKEIWLYQPSYNRIGLNNNSYCYLVVKKSPFHYFMCYSNDEILKIKENDIFFRINLSKLQLEQSINILRKIIPFCIKQSSINCWDNQLKLCNNDCREGRNANSNFQNIKNIINAFKGKDLILNKKLEEEISNSIDFLQYEDARKKFTLLEVLKRIQQQFFGEGYLRDIDQLSIEHKNGYSQKRILKMKSYLNKSMVYSKNKEFIIPNSIGKEKVIFYNLIEFYSSLSSPPKIIELEFPMNQKEAISFERWLRRFYGCKIELELP